METTKLVLHSRDDRGIYADNCYCAIIMIWGNSCWCNTGIVIRDLDPICAVKKAIEIAIAERLWK